MEIRFLRKPEDASIMLGMVVLITFIFLIFMLYTVSARVKRIKPRSFDVETNEVAHFQVEWLRSAVPPIHQDSPPLGASAQTVNSFTNELIFPWYPGLDGWLYIWRTEDWYNHTLLYYVMFEEKDRYITNSSGDIFVIVRFVDQYALDGKAFYDGVIRTNTP